MGKTVEVKRAALTEKLSEQELCPDALLGGQEAAFARDIARLQARRAEFVSVGCPACGSTEATYRLEKFTFRYLTCQRCGTLYMSPRPSPAVMASYYSSSENYAYWAKYIFPASEASRREKLHRPWLRRVLDFCERHAIPRGLLVEVGPGFGTFCQVAQESGQFREVVGIEPTPEMAEACRQRGVRVIPQGIEQITGEVAGADVIVAFEVVEHLFEPRHFFLQAARLLRPGGLLVVSCPNGQGFDVAMLGSLSLAVDAEHVNLFNPQSLSLLVNACGFEVLEVSTPGRLDAEFVHEAVQRGDFDVSHDPFLQRVLVEEWDRLGWPFQQFLAENGLSSHMWLAARRLPGEDGCPKSQEV
jgi:SAM-dependent methyltransferase